MLAEGAVFTGRDPLTLLFEGQTLRVRHGMLISYSGFLDLVEPARDHEWPEALRQMAIELCVKHLDEAVKAVEMVEGPALSGPSANDSQH